MNETIFLSQVWGPVLAALGLGFFVSRKYYVKLYRDLETQSLALLVFGISAIAAGIAHILTHNAWGNLAEVIISFLGWGLLLKGLIFAVTPGWVDRAGDWEADSKLVPLVGAFMLILGAYLCWVGFVM